MGAFLLKDEREREERESFMRNYPYERDLVQCKRRPIRVSKETYYRIKRDLVVSKET